MSSAPSWTHRLLLGPLRPLLRSLAVGPLPGRGPSPWPWALSLAVGPLPGRGPSPLAVGRLPGRGPPPWPWAFPLAVGPVRAGRGSAPTACPHALAVRWQARANNTSNDLC
eukprot:gene20148-biopygen17560